MPSSSRDDQIVRAALRDPRRAIVEIDKVDCGESLIEFTKRAWHTLEPAIPFTSGWAVEAMADHLEAVTRGEITRLLINVPPGFTKSMLTNVFWPAWEWGPRGMSTMRYISASYDKSLSIRDLVRCRDLITSEWYRERWPIQFKKDQDGKEFYGNTSSGWRFSASVGSGLTGWRGDRIIVDDPHNVKSAESEADRESALLWFTETLPTRYNRPGKSALVLIMQRLHMQDCSGHVIEKLSDEYTKLILPMEHEEERRCRTHVVVRDTGLPFVDPRTTEGQLLWPERFDRKSVDELKKALSSKGGSYAVAGQLQQRPVHRGGTMFKRAHLPIIDKMPAEPVRLIRGWDLAATEDGGSYTVGLKLALLPNGHMVIVDVVRGQWSSGEVRSTIRATTRQDGHAVRASLPQDPGQAGKDQKMHYLTQIVDGYDVHFSPESGDKVDRAGPVAAAVENGLVSLLRGPWNDAFLAEAEVFPKDAVKDQIDALSRAHSLMFASREQEFGEAGTLSFEEVDPSLGW